MEPLFTRLIAFWTGVFRWPDDRPVLHTGVRAGLSGTITNTAELQGVGTDKASGWLGPKGLAVTGTDGLAFLLLSTSLIGLGVGVRRRRRV